MLTNNVVKACIPLAALWTDNGLVAKPFDGSPLALLVHHQRKKTVLHQVYYAENKAALEVDKEGRMTQIADTLCSDVDVVVADSEVSDVKETEVMDFYAEELGKKVVQHINIAKNVVKPEVIDLIERINCGLNSVTAESILDVQIVQFDVPKSFSDPRFVAPLGKYQDENYPIPTGTVGLPQLEWETLVEKLKVGIDEIDEQNIGFLINIGKDKLKVLFEEIFLDRATHAIERAPISLIDFFKDPEFNTQYILAAYLWANSFYDDPPQGTNASLSEYNKKLVDIREIAGARLHKQVRIHEQNLKDKVLVKKFYNNKVEVYSNVYDAFLENGGTPETLLGLVFSTNKNFTYDLILERADELTRAWQVQCANLKLNEKSRRSNFIFRIALESFLQQLRASQTEMEGLENNIFKIYEDGRKILSEMSLEELNNITEVAMRLVCRARFPKTAAESFLRDINAAKELDPAMDIEDAEAVATMRYISRFAANQIDVKYVGTKG